MSTAADFVTRCYRGGDEQGIIAGFSATFDESQAIENWRWKYCYGDEKPTIAVTSGANGEIVCQYAVIPLRMNIEGQQVSAGQPVDIFCLRRPGTIRYQVYRRTYQEFEKQFCGPGRNYKLLLGFPNARALRQGQLQMGYPSDAPRVPVWSKNVNGRICSRFRREIRRGRPVVGDQFATADIDNLWQRSAHRYPVSVIRDYAWVYRRYLSRPQVYYSFLVVRRQGQITAWAAFLACNSVLNWVDLVWDGCDKNDLNKIIKMARRLAITGGQKEIQLWLMGDQEVQNLLSEAGWRADHETPIWFAHRFYEKGILGASTFCDRFYLTMGVSDHV